MNICEDGNMNEVINMNANIDFDNIITLVQQKLTNKKENNRYSCETLLKVSLSNRKSYVLNDDLFSYFNNIGRKLSLSGYHQENILHIEDQFNELKENFWIMGGKKKF